MLDPREVALQQDGRIAEHPLREAADADQLGAQGALVDGNRHPHSAATGRGLDHDRVADTGGRLDRGVDVGDRFGGASRHRRCVRVLGSVVLYVRDRRMVSPSSVDLPEPASLTRSTARPQRAERSDRPKRRNAAHAEALSVAAFPARPQRPGAAAAEARRHRAHQRRFGRGLRPDLCERAGSARLLCARASGPARSTHTTHAAEGQAQRPPEAPQLRAHPRRFGLPVARGGGCGPER